MITRTIYRIEDAENVGMYSRGRKTDFLYEDLDNAIDHNGYLIKHPTPAEDSLLKPHSNRITLNHLFGFDSIGQLRTWVYKDDWINKLNNCGFKLAIIEIEYSTLQSDAFYPGHTQVIFHKGNIKKNTHVSLLDLLKSELTWED